MFPVNLVIEISQRIHRVTLPGEKPNYVRDPESFLTVLPSNLHDVCLALREFPDYLFDLPLQMTAVDFINEKVFELVYYLYSSKLRQGIIVKTQVPRTAPEIESVSDIWPGMDWQEREVYDLFGVKFRNHPNLKRIMMWEGFSGHPLRKDYVHQTDKYDSGLEIGTPGLDERGVPIP